MGIIRKSNVPVKNATVSFWRREHSIQMWRQLRERQEDYTLW